PSSYMVRGISNKTISLLRKAGRDTELTESDGQIPETNEFSSGESESQLNRELQLIQALNELPAQRKEAFLLAHFYNFSYLEISNRMQISVNTVKTHLRLAMLQLRETLLSILTFLFFS
ncbi:MAG TPA: RNA polymerase sigma factor, partial [Parasegetibacter sp.]